ncbi:mechanosensitive ion channel family protein [Haloarcula sp. S1AR25-5A]|uniref:Mechanosensitive ion channel family protein n=1 Tax=Haloarcula terrestris TaxID=2950533 RepID=A0AAE4EYG9_9EURY|nr:mechanosensitive ion channel domain-containing protein [Haloarcula terrestris]MDS0222551.1 mechanosensitive ion channel family protein [Haloarcula terrestris]
MQVGVINRALEQLVSNVVDALPRLITAFVFLAVATVGIKAIMFVVRAVLKRSLPGESPVYRQFLGVIVLVFLWFGVALSFLSIVGLTAIAASLGTATGFLALGVSYALSEMIKDAVAGVYLLRDPDFNPGDTIKAGDTTGEVAAIELRKTRFRVDGDTVVRANAAIEERWTKVESGS